MQQKPVLAFWLACLLAVAWWTTPVQAATTVSCNPPNGATDVSANTQIVFTFSSSMNPSFIFVTCSNLTADTFVLLPSGVWSAGNTVLTYTPAPALPGDSVIAWYVLGVDATFQPLAGATSGTFTTGTGSGGSGSGTNAITSFQVGKINYWNQTSAAAPVPDAAIPYYFTGGTTLASNRTATSISLTLPTATVTNLSQNPIKPENYYYYSYSTASNDFETSFPQGTYTFNISATASNQTVPVVLPQGMTQPNAPYLTNYAAAQSLDAAQAFTLAWEPFVGGTSADYIYVAIGDNAWQTPELGTTNALNGTATTVTIPANSLKANSNYTAYIGFYHALVVSNATYATEAFRATATQFTVNTIGSSLPVVSNVVCRGGTCSFDILTTFGQSLTVVSSADCALPLAQWQTLLTTNSPGSRVQVIDPRPATGRAMFYRVRNGP
jgi:hypothetical protein